MEWCLLVAFRYLVGRTSKPSPSNNPHFLTYSACATGNPYYLISVTSTRQDIAALWSWPRFMQKIVIKLFWIYSPTSSHRPKHACRLSYHKNRPTNKRYHDSPWDNPYTYSPTSSFPSCPGRCSTTSSFPTSPSLTKNNRRRLSYSQPTS